MRDEELTPRHRDIAQSVQAMYEEAFFHLLNHLWYFIDTDGKISQRIV